MDFTGTPLIPPASRMRVLPCFDHTPFGGRCHPVRRKAGCVANAQLLPQPHWPLSSEERLGTFILHCGTERLVAEALGGRVFRRCSVRFMLRLPPLQASWATNLDAYRAGLPRPVHPGFRLVSHLLEAPNNATGASWATPRVGLSPTGCMMLQAATSLLPGFPGRHRYLRTRPTPDRASGWLSASALYRTYSPGQDRTLPA